MNKPGEAISQKSNWLCLVTKSYGEVFSFLQNLSIEGFQPFEVGPLGEKGFLLAEVSSSQVSFLEKELSRSSAQLKILKDIDARVINSYLSLESSPTKQFLLFGTFLFIGEALQTAQQALDQGFEIVDLRMIRSSEAITHLILTGSDVLKAQSFKMGSSTTQVLIENPSSSLKNYFDIQV